MLNAFFQFFLFFGFRVSFAVVVLVDVVLVDVVLVEVVLFDVVILFYFSLWRTQLFLILSPLVRHQGTAGRIL